MLDSLRRVFWLIPALALGAALLFLVLAKTIARPTPEGPLFWNPEPLSAERAALSALADLERGNATAPSRLAELGGAALPFLLPRLPTLSVETQRRLAEALWPVALRMGLFEDGGASDTVHGSAAPVDVDVKLAFWQRYYEDHAIEFRPLTVQRLSKRLASRDLRLRRADLLVVDTYALPSLIAQLGSVRTQEDAERVRRVAALVSHLTERDWTLPEHPDVATARARASALRRFWDRHGAQWTELGPIELGAAHGDQTEFYFWGAARLRELVGVDSSHVGDRFRARARVSGMLFAFTFAGAILLGPALAGFVQLVSTRRHDRIAGVSSSRVLLSVLLGLAVPGVLLHPPGHPVVAGIFLMIVATLSSAYVLERELLGRIEWRTQSVLAQRPGLVRLRAVVDWLGPTIPTLGPLAAAEAVVFVACVESSAHIRGLGAETITAVGRGDLPWLLSMSLVLGALLGVLQLLADALFATSSLHLRGRPR